MMHTLCQKIEELFK